MRKSGGRRRPAVLREAATIRKFAPKKSEAYYTPGRGTVDPCVSILFEPGSVAAAKRIAKGLIARGYQLVETGQFSAPGFNVRLMLSGTWGRISVRSV